MANEPLKPLCYMIQVDVAVECVAEMFMANEPLKPFLARRRQGRQHLVAEMFMANEPLKPSVGTDMATGIIVAEMFMANEPLKRRH